MSRLFKNNASTTLKSNFSSSAFSFEVDTGDGSLFPSITAPDHFYVTIEDAQKNREIVDVTARSGDNFTCTRAKEGTSARDWLAGDLVELRLTSAFIQDLNAGVLSVAVDGGGITLTTGVKGYVEIPFACSLQSVTALANISGSIQIDIWKCTYAQFDAGSTHPVDADSITAAAPISLASTYKYQDLVLTGWTKEFAEGDILAFNVDSVSLISRVLISMRLRRS